MTALATRLFFGVTDCWLLSLGQKKKRVAVTPDGEVEALDLAQHRVLPLPRAALHLARVIGDAKVFGTITLADLELYRRECLSLAPVMGEADAVVAGVGARGHMVVSDASHVDFAAVISEADIANPDLTITSGAVGIHSSREAGGTQPSITIERVALAELEAWKDRMRSVPGRDLRVALIVRESEGMRSLVLRQSLNVYRDTTLADWVEADHENRIQDRRPPEGGGEAQ